MSMQFHAVRSGDDIVLPRGSEAREFLDWHPDHGDNRLECNPEYKHWTHFSASNAAACKIADFFRLEGGNDVCAFNMSPHEALKRVRTKSFELDEFNKEDAGKMMLANKLMTILIVAIERGATRVYMA